MIWEIIAFLATNALSFVVGAFTAAYLYQQVYPERTQK